MNTSLHIYVEESQVYLPTVAQSEAGFYVEIEPVRVVQKSDLAAIAKAVLLAMELGNPSIRTPSRAKLSKPVVLGYAVSKSWTQFERKATSWGVEEREDAWTIVRYRQRQDGRGTEPERSSAVSVSKTSSASDIAAEIASIVSHT